VSTSNGTAGRSTGSPPASGQTSAAGSKKTPRTPRRLVLLADGDDSTVERVLAEYSGTETNGKGVHEDIQRLAAAHPGRCVAAEWLSPLGWTRFLWCRKT
jgi:hypothetical protein